MTAHARVFRHAHLACGIGAGMGETFTLSTREIWVKPLALALAVDTDQVAIQMDGGRA